MKSSSLLKGVKSAGSLTGSSQRRHSFLMTFPTGHGRKSELTCLLTGVETMSFVLIITLRSGKSIPLTTLLQEQ